MRFGLLGYEAGIGLIEIENVGFLELSRGWLLISALFKACHTVSTVITFAGHMARLVVVSFN